VPHTDEQAVLDRIRQGLVYTESEASFQARPDAAPTSSSSTTTTVDLAAVGSKVSARPRATTR